MVYSLPNTSRQWARHLFIDIVSNPTAALNSRHYSSHFKDEETKDQRGYVIVQHHKASGWRNQDSLRSAPIQSLYPPHYTTLIAEDTIHIIVLSKQTTSSPLVTESANAISSVCSLFSL